MKSIKEKSEEYGKNGYQRKRIFSDRCRGCYAHVISSYEAGANYVLDEIEKILPKENKCLNDYGKALIWRIEDTIEQLKK